VLTAWCEWFSTQCTLLLDGCLWTAQTFEERMEQQVSAIDGIHNISHMWGDTRCLFTSCINMIASTRSSLLHLRTLIYSKVFMLKLYDCIIWTLYKSLAWPTFRSHRTNPIVSLERGVCSFAVLQVFSCYRDVFTHGINFLCVVMLVVSFIHISIRLYHITFVRVQSGWRNVTG